jgi:hypothetical protein
MVETCTGQMSHTPSPPATRLVIPLGVIYNAAFLVRKGACREAVFCN